jgi:predicted nucleic acid-binding protein
MTVVSNTSPLNYLALIGLERLLPAMFGRVIIPLAVREELKASGAPVEVRDLLDRSRGWLEAVSAPSVSDPILAGLDPGEKEAIGLAVSMRANLILLDEARGRRAATEHLGLTVTGTLGVLDRAARAGLIDATDVVERLRKTNFRASPKLYQLLLGPATKPATTRHKNEPKTGSRAKEQEEESD